MALRGAWLSVVRAPGTWRGCGVRGAAGARSGAPGERGVRPTCDVSAALRSTTPHASSRRHTRTPLHPTRVCAVTCVVAGTPGYWDCPPRGTMTRPTRTRRMALARWMLSRTPSERGSSPRVLCWTPCVSRASAAARAPIRALRRRRPLASRQRSCGCSATSATCGGRSRAAGTRRRCRTRGSARSTRMRTSAGPVEALRVRMGAPVVVVALLVLPEHRFLGAGADTRDASSCSGGQSAAAVIFRGRRGLDKSSATSPP